MFLYIHYIFIFVYKKINKKKHIFDILLSRFTFIFYLIFFFVKVKKM